MLPSSYGVKQVNKNSSWTACPHNPSKHQELLYLTFDTDDPNPQQHCHNFKTHVHKFGIMLFDILEILMYPTSVVLHLNVPFSSCRLLESLNISCTTDFRHVI